MSFGRRLTEVIAIAFLMYLPASCKTPGELSSEALGTSTPALPLSVETIESIEQFTKISKDSSGIIKNGRVMKFFIDIRDPEAPKIHFINSNFTVNGVIPEYAKFHFDFAKKWLNVPEGLDEFNKMTYFVDDKRYMAGTIQTYLLDERTQPLFGVSFYPQDVIHGIKTLKAVQIVKAAFKVPDLAFAFVEAGSQQKTDDVAADYVTAKIERLSIDKILGSIKYIPLHQGEAWGYLRIFPANQDQLTAADIPVFDDLPLDLTVIAATITKAYQDSNSHINLKANERNTPNAVLRDAGPDQKDLAPFDNKPVHIVVGPDKLVIEATTPELIAQKLKLRFDKPWVPITWTSSQKLLTYDAMCPTQASSCLKLGASYGSKAANLGFLTNSKVLGRVGTSGTLSAKLGYDLVPKGFGIPLQFYKNLVDYPANTVLKAKLAALIQKEKANSLSAAQRVALLKEVQELFYNAKFPPDDLAKIKAQLTATLGGIEKVKVRSSANAEDIEGFDGAGLHDSYSAKLAATDHAQESCTREEDASEGGGGETKAKMKPRTIACAIKGVYASLWNKRAIEERSFSRIDHSTVSMGISVLPAYDLESEIKANSVVVTRVINTEDVFGYTLSIQKDNNLVTNPEPSTFSEVTIAGMGVGAEPTSLTVTRYAKPTRDATQLTTSVLTKQQMLDLVAISKKVEEAYCQSKPGYFPDDCRWVSVDSKKPKSLDMEFKFLANGHFVCKQVREFSGH